jgi:hypothetical protein
MKKRCIVLGAGFSKAIANLPITSEMFTTFEKILNEQKTLSNSLHVSRGESIFCFLNLLRSKYLNDSRIQSSNLTDNFEGICSFIDLNLSFDIEAMTKDDKGEIGHLTTSLWEHDTSFIREVRWSIGFYLYLTLINKYGDDRLLDKFYNKLLENTQSIITFNYDLVLEKYLFDRHLWFPTDGYNIDFQNKSNYDYPTSKIKIYKLHGSLNWNCDYQKLSLEWNGVDNFPVYPVDEKNIYYSSGSWMLPSFIKQFSFPEFVNIWNATSRQINESDEVYFIGYRLPPEDSAVYSLLSAIDFTNKSITVIDPSANNEDFIERFVITLRKEKSNINFLPFLLQNYLCT